jgi:catechol 2,3-dioxygenase-like lactoylglutathione lyase family enzyme
MITQAVPKLPMRNQSATKKYYLEQLGFSLINEYPGYLLVEKDNAELHFFIHNTLVPEDNYGQVYLRVNNISDLYSTYYERGLVSSKLETKPWGQKEFALLDPDHNLLTFGEALT